MHTYHTKTIMILHYLDIIINFGYWNNIIKFLKGALLFTNNNNEFFINLQQHQEVMKEERLQSL
jgi:hypothetical protein